MQDYNNIIILWLFFVLLQNTVPVRIHIISTPPIWKKRNQLPGPHTFFFASNFDLIRTFAENMQIYVYYETAEYLIPNYENGAMFGLNKFDKIR